MSKELIMGLRLGSSSIDILHVTLRKSLGEWGRLLPYLDNIEQSVLDELELVASINYLLGKDVELTPPLKARMASAVVQSEKKLLLSDKELQLMGGGHGEEKQE